MSQETTTQNGEYCLSTTKATITNQCAAPTTVQRSMRVWPTVSRSIVARRVPRAPERVGSGWPRRTTRTMRTTVDGAWYRCCGGHVRKLVDCCGYVRTRVNGDKALTGYCYRGRKVFCVQYYDTKVPC